MEGQANWWANDPIAEGAPAPAMPSMSSSMPAEAKSSINGGNDWWANDPVAKISNPSEIEKTSSNVATSTVEKPPDRGLGEQLIHTAGVGATGLAKGRLAVTPAGLAINAPSIGLQLGSMAGIPLAYGVNLAMGNAAPWENAKMTARDVQQKIAENVPNTNSIIDKSISWLPKPENKLEQYIDSASQFAGGAKGMKQSAGLGAAAGLASEAAGQATLGSAFEPGARMAAGFVPFAAGKAMGGQKIEFNNPMKQDETIIASEGNVKGAVGKVQQQASYPGPLAGNLAKNLGQNEGQLVEGVKPTLGEVAGDQGLAQAQNAIKQRYPQPFQAAEQQRQLGMAQSLDKNANIGRAEDVGQFVGGRINEADKAAADQISAVGRYGEQPEKNPLGDPIADARSVRKELEGQKWEFLDDIKDEPADVLTLRNKAQDLLDEGQQYGVGGLHPSVNQIVDQVLKPPEGAADTVNTLKLFRSQISDAKSTPNLPATAMRQLGDLQQAVDKGIQNTVAGKALDQPEGVPSAISANTPNKYAEARAETMKNYTLKDLEQRGAINQEGRIVTKKMDSWRANPKNRQRLMADKNLNQPLQGAIEAQRSVDKLKDNPLSLTADVNNDPIKVVDKIMRSKTLDAAKQSKAAMDYVADDPASVAVLKSIYAKWINDNIAKSSINKDINNKESGHIGRPNDFQHFFNMQRKALEQIYNQEELKNVEMVAREIQRNQEYERMANIKGQSNTAKNMAQNQASMMKSGFNWIMGQLSEYGPSAGAIEGFHQGGVGGALAGATIGKAVSVVNKLREKGIENKEMLELAMYTNPKFAHEMLQRFSGAKPNEIFTNRIINSLDSVKTLVPAETISTKDANDKRYK